MQKQFSAPVLIENDVNLGGLGIKKYEFKDNVNNMLVVFVGTGIGGALFFNGQLYRGSSFYAGEIGHMKVSSAGLFAGDFKKSTFENIASRTAIVNGILKDAENGKCYLDSEIKAKKKIKSKMLKAALENKDKIVMKNLSKACGTIGTVLGSLTTLLNLDTIVLGGGAIEANEEFMLPKIERAVMKTVIKGPGQIIKVSATKLGDYAPLYGGLALADEFLK